jgi:hypothetical protein
MLPGVQAEQVVLVLMQVPQADWVQIHHMHIPEDMGELARLVLLI